jgi:Leucine-rich repeat (LRR) protein
MTRLPTIREIYLGNAQVKNSHLQYVARLPDMRWVCFAVEQGKQAPRITADGIRHLARCRSIETIILNPACQPCDAGLASVGQMRNVRELSFMDSTVTDVGVEHLHGLPRLETLSMTSNRITDRGLAALESLPNLKHLFLQDVQLTDEGMLHIGRCNNLQEIRLICSGARSFTDRGLQALRGLKNAKQITVLSSPVTAGGVAELQRALPRCKVVKW